jgi:hypothetical protein
VVVLLAPLLIVVFVAVRWGETCLHVAARLGHRDMVLLLLNYGSDATLEGANGTARQVALTAKQLGIYQVRFSLSLSDSLRLALASVEALAVTHPLRATNPRSWAGTRTARPPCAPDTRTQTCNALYDVSRSCASSFEGTSPLSCIASVRRCNPLLFLLITYARTQSRFS